MAQERFQANVVFKSFDWLTEDNQGNWWLASSRPTAPPHESDFRKSLGSVDLAVQLSFAANLFLPQERSLARHTVPPW